MWYLFSFILLTNLASIDSLQNENEQITFTIEKNLEQEQLSDLLNLNSSNKLNQPLIFYTIQNNTTDHDKQVVLDLLVTSDVYGELYRTTQNRNTPINLAAGDSIRFSDLDIINGNVPGVDGRPQFDFVLSSSGRTIISRLYRGAAIDDHSYKIQATLSAVSDDSVEAERIAEKSTDFETTLKSNQLSIAFDEEANDDLSTINFSSDNPVFKWSGRDDLTYRLVVVHNQKDVNSLDILSTRFNTPHSDNNIHDPENHVYLDVKYEGTRYQLPNQYRNLIEPGHEYVWQVKGGYPTVSSEVEVATEPAYFVTGKKIEGELLELLTTFLGSNKVKQISENGLQLHRLEINGIEYTAHEAVRYLRELKLKINRQQATIGG